MKPIAISLLITLALCSLVNAAETLTTANYVVTISVNCEEGNVTCDDVTYHGVSKKTGKAITLKGTTMHTKCADGETPCRFLGYEFKNGDITYRALVPGLLQVVKGGSKVLLEEEGEWDY
jgi:hypothetical protein